MKRLILALIRFLLRFTPGFHLHRDPAKRGKKPKTEPLTPEEINKMILDMGKEDETSPTPEIEAKEA